MSGRYQCENCNWQGDEPTTAHPEYEDGGWPACPNGCTEQSDGLEEPRAVVLDPAHPENQRRYAQALARLWGQKL